MTDNTKHGSFLLIAVVCIGIFLAAFVGIPFLTSTHSQLSTVTQTPAPSPVPNPEVSVDVKETTAVPSIPATSITQPPTVEITTSATQQTTSPVQRQTTIVQESASPIAAPAVNDPILGTWSGSKTMKIVIVNVDSSGFATFQDDFSGSASGEFHGAGRDGTFGADFVWENLVSGKYQGNYGDKSLEFTLSGDVLTMTVNPKKLGLMDSEIVNMDIPFEMYRV